MISSTVGLKILMMFSMLSLVVIGGLAIFCFTKAFGIVFLGTARHINTEHVHEMKWYTLFPQYIILAVIVLIGVYPGLISGLFFGIAGLYIHPAPAIATTYVINTTYISQFTLLFIGITLLMLLVKKLFMRNKVIEYKPTWGCAYTGNAEKMQYTASSYAENYSHDMDKLLNQKTHYKAIPDNDIFPKERTYKTHSESRIEERFFIRLSGLSKRYLTGLLLCKQGRHNIISCICLYY